ncbi:hypothetical protein RhiirA5_359464 [Rhizophagus irregularis]|uniref:Uncharacterized protein n=1 Tax=Rhizophagus irregularis TaxID=588596 RepID=A0A2I1F0H2_9GLOM|nr:hypothetical protein RhiirA5_359464 [Rhizophagus irregularis]PKC63939.1 hypothetical protein RhiirA1_422170 [Rhizophagus irregularis]PKY27881.1 hypothetical protein RhiirB3_416492 [Rhizophagus irregularis]CAB4485881.1 unnamed protein product [Rhizophagus irregularis]CAB5203588.1 unnamed protein product [Rhizophagus irregularis]
MSDNNSTVNNNNSLTIDCGVRNYCYNSQVCFAAPEGPICGNVNNNITTYSWKLNSAVFPPIEYIGSTIGRKQRDPCEMFDYNLWSDENKSWLLTFFYQNWNLTNPIPPGSFVRPLDFIGSCSNIVISATDISLQQLYCDNNKCRKKINTNTQRANCVSSNQCLTQLCGLTTINQPADGNITVTNTTCINDGFIAYNQLKGSRSFNVIQGDDVNVKSGNNSDNIDDPKNSSGSMVVIIIILVILFASMAIYGYARKMFKKRDNNEDDTHYLRREIDPETGEIITISTAGGRLRRGTSILNRGASLNRSNSIRTLPPYSVVDEERPPSSSNGIVNSIAQFFFPPGELPPPYDSLEENVSNNNTVLDITLDEVREGVTIEGNGNGNGNDNGNGGDGGDGNGNGNDSGNGNDNSNGNGNNSTNSTSSLPVRSTSPKIDDGESHPRELSMISEVIPEVTVDDSEADKVEGGKKVEEEKGETINTGLSEEDKKLEGKSETINTGLSDVKIEEGKSETINTGLSDVKIEEGGNETSNIVLSEDKTEEGGSEAKITVEDKVLLDKKMEEGGNETNTT